MTADTTRFAASEARKAQDIRRAKVAPLLAVGMSVRAIAAETGIPIGAVHRAKRQLEKDRHKEDKTLPPLLSNCQRATW